MTVLFHHSFSAIRHTIALLLLLLSISPLTAQNLSRAKQVVDSLCAPYMNGRGYTFKGDKIAANFIKKEFEKAGLSFFSRGAFQRFKLDVNTFNGAMSLKLGNNTLRPGKDYMAHPASPQANGSGKVLIIDSVTIQYPNSKLSKVKWASTIVVYDEAISKEISKLPPHYLRQLEKAKAQIILVDKLTGWLSRNQQRQAKFMVLKEAFVSKAKKAQFKLDAEMKYGYRTQNVIGYIEGKTQPDSFMVFTAHYDHLGNMGKETYFPGGE